MKTNTYNGGVELQRVDLDTEGGCGALAEGPSDGCFGGRNRRAVAKAWAGRLTNVLLLELA